MGSGATSTAFSNGAVIAGFMAILLVLSGVKAFEHYVRQLGHRLRARAAERRNLPSRLAALEAEAREARQHINVLTAERDQHLAAVLKWQAVAVEMAEREKAAVAALGGATEGGRGADKYGRLRTVVIKTLHPDHAGGSGLERAAKGELFKVVWPEIEKIDAG